MDKVDELQRTMAIIREEMIPKMRARGEAAIEQRKVRSRRVVKALSDSGMRVSGRGLTSTRGG